MSNDFPGPIVLPSPSVAGDAPQTPDQPCASALSGGQGRGASNYDLVDPEHDVYRCSDCSRRFNDWEVNKERDVGRVFLFCPFCDGNPMGPTDYYTPAKVWHDTYDADFDGEGYIGSCECPHCGDISNHYTGAQYKGEVEFECVNCGHTSEEMQ